MSMENMDRILKILNEQLAKLLNGNIITSDSNLVELGLNSVTFMKTIVALEKEFKIEFAEEKLKLTAFKTPMDILAYIEAEL